MTTQTLSTGHRGHRRVTGSTCSSRRQTASARQSAMSDFWISWTLNVLYDEGLGVTASPVQGRHVKRFSGDIGAP
ncbi:hypothetical protein ABID26_004717 [Mesorhizobium shonense]|uniref:Uncharacterized protein n=1 Tax=Mesorhizobium shonense TaxID=1209948 RepID=A0ABV2HXE3_9HYPH|nr:hypothetical protein [Mesorhizobium sp. M1A.F.Ca.ET.072.01.1.1]